MAFGGILAGAFGGAGQAMGEVATSRIRTNELAELRRLDAELDVEKTKQVERLKQTFAREQKLWETTGAGGDAERASAKKRLEELGPVEAKLAGKKEGVIVTARGEAERENLAKYGSDPAAREGVRAKAADAESPSSKVHAAAAGYKLGRDKANDVLRDQIAQLRAAGRDDDADKLERVLSTKEGKSSAKSYADVVAAARVFASMAEQKQKTLNDPVASAEMTPEQRTGMAAEIDALQSKAEELLAGAAEKRGVPVSGDGKKAPKGGAPYREGARLVGPDGKFYVVKNGKPVLE